MEDLFDRVADWSHTQDARDWANFFGWLVAGLLGGATLTLPIWMYLLHII